VSARGWIGVDLDGTLAHYDEWRGVEHIGEPVPAMVERVRAWLKAGRDVRIFTARVYRADVRAELYVRAWCKQHIGQELPVTCVKDYNMTELWDDRAVAVERNTGAALSWEVDGYVL
jgi:hypothetical protein